MPTPITDADLLAIQSQLSPLQDKLNTPLGVSHPFCYPALQLLSTWIEQGDSTGTHGPCTIIPGTLTTPMKVDFTPATRHLGHPWDNVYVLHRNAYQPATLFAYVTNVTFPSASDIANCNAYEQDFQINDGSAIFNWGWQFLFGVGLRIWDRSVGGWIKTPVAEFSPFMPGIPKRIVVEFSRTATALTYLGVGIDGLWTPLSNTLPNVSTPQSPYLNNAVQVDSKGAGAPINFLLSECNVGGF